MDKLFFINSDLIKVIIGGLIGAFGALASQYLAFILRKGKLKVDISDWELKLLKQDGAGSFESALSPNDASYAEYRISLDFYNSSFDPLSLRKISFNLFSSKKSIKSIPKILSRNITNVAPQFIEVAVLNFPAKQITQCIFSGSIPHSELWIIEKNYSLYFEALTPKGTKFIKRIQ